MRLIVIFAVKNVEKINQNCQNLSRYAKNSNLLEILKIFVQPKLECKLII